MAGRGGLARATHRARCPAARHQRGARAARTGSHDVGAGSRRGVGQCICRRGRKSIPARGTNAGRNELGCGRTARKQTNADGTHRAWVGILARDQVCSGAVGHGVVGTEEGSKQTRTRGGHREAGTDVGHAHATTVGGCVGTDRGAHCRRERGHRRRAAARRSANTRRRGSCATNSTSDPKEEKAAAADGRGHEQ